MQQSIDAEYTRVIAVYWMREQITYRLQGDTVVKGK